MKDNIKVIIYFSVFVVFMIFAYAGYNMLSESTLNEQLENDKMVKKSGKEEKIKLEKFDLYLENGEKISSEQLFTGKPLVINIWTSWCTYCDIEMKYFNELYLQDKDNITLVMINATGDRDSKEAARKYVEDNGFSFDIYYDLNLEALSSLGVYSYPTTIFVDKDGYVDSYNIGTITKEQLQNKIERLK